MQKRKHLWAWTNRAALNLGATISCLWHTVLPPQIDHNKEDIKLLSKSTPTNEFLIELGMLSQTKKKNK